MSDWTDGYVTEIGYTYGYYVDLNPLRTVVPFLNVGLAPPNIATACELGFGQGLSLNVHAAASDVTWYGTDFNPGHATFARSLAEAAGSGAQLFEQSFAEFCARADLPDFDFVGLHGILSWISEENQQIVVDFLRRKLKPGGVLFLSYNCLPGHAATVPLRHLLMQHAGKMSAPSRGIIGRIDSSLDFAEALLAVNPVFAVANPTLGDRLKAIKGHDRHYLAHEYFNRDWRALLFADLAESLGAAKLSFACSAHYLDHIDALNLTADHHKFLSEIADPVFRQSVRDFVVNQSFRRDYWVKGGRRMSALAQAEALRRLRVMLLVGQRSDVAMTIQGAIGQREISPSVYNPILDALADRRPRTLGEIEQAVSGAGLRLPAIYESVMVLAGRGELAVVQDDAVQAMARPKTDRLNRHICELARGGGEIQLLASPVTGSGMLVSRFDQLFLLGQAQGRDSADDMARFAWEILAAQGQRMLKDGKALESPEDNLTELAAQARDFLGRRLPVYQALQLL